MVADYAACRQVVCLPWRRGTPLLCSCVRRPGAAALSDRNASHVTLGSPCTVATFPCCHAYSQARSVVLTLEPHVWRQ